ncbi:hypothetical protein [Carboxylicivirga caseinilyticus]|uniref:hypothetical protein n=1 Tax=Carboxylicivirga caseinilyticus TaxID=3417572 RepID=UPI002AA67D00|nr:hypothetical protein [uncultured Carboxylicivirga sp.]MCU4163935.1 hypothetical protein [Marinilabiliaceae bacterium A049]
MAKIKNIEGLTINDINRELSKGAKFVVYQYCISIIVMTFKRGSNIYFIRSGESSSKYIFGYSILTFLFGWWGIPWGPIHTIGSLATNFTGGKNVTPEVLASINSAA